MSGSNSGAGSQGSQNTAHLSGRSGTGLGAGSVPRQLKNGGSWTGQDSLSATALDVWLNIPGELDPRITFTRASTASYTDAGGVMRSAAVNQPRWDFNPATLALNGLLIEEARTNIIRNNTAVGAVVGTPGTLPTTGWSVFSANGLATNVVGFGTSNGIAYVDLRFVGTTTGTFYVLALDSAGAVASSGQVWTASLYHALVGGSLANVTLVSLDHRFTGGTVPQQIFTPTATLTRAVHTATAGASVTLDVPAIQIQFANGVPIDLTLRLGLPMLELGGHASSAIPTAGAAVTRAADGASLPIGAWYNQSAGSLAGTFMPAYIPPAAINPVVAEFDDGTVNTVASLRIATTSAMLATIVVASANLVQASTVNLVAVSAPQRAALTWNPSALNVCLNGGAVGTIAPTALPATVTRLALGTGRTTQLNGWLSRVRYWPRALSNVELQAVTT